MLDRLGQGIDMIGQSGETTLGQIDCEETVPAGDSIRRLCIHWFRNCSQCCPRLAAPGNCSLRCSTSSIQAVVSTIAGSSMLAMRYGVCTQIRANSYHDHDDQGSSEQVVMPSCQRKLASRIGLTADAFQDLDSGFRRNDDLIRASPGF